MECPCPSVLNNFVTPRHLFIQALRDLSKESFQELKEFATEHEVYTDPESGKKVTIVVLVGGKIVFLYICPKLARLKFLRDVW